MSAAAESTTRSRHLPLLAAGVTVVLWASAFVAIRYVGQEFSATSLTLGRLMAGCLTLALMLLAQRLRERRTRVLPGVRPSRAHLGLLVLCGVAWFAVYNLALNAAEQQLDAGTTSMLVNIGPVLIAVLAGWVLHEGFPQRLLVGMGISLLGAVIIGVGTSGGADVPVRGVLLTLLAAVVYAIGVVAQKPVLRVLPALEVTLIAAAIGMVVCLPFLPQLLDELGRAGAQSIVWLVYLGVFPTAIAFTTWAYALARTTAGRLGSTTYIVPPLTVLMGWVLLGESPVLAAYLGGALCLFGVAVSRGFSLRRRR